VQGAAGDALLPVTPAWVAPDTGSAAAMNTFSRGHLPFIVTDIGCSML
jgi:hypothetical protein